MRTLVLLALAGLGAQLVDGSLGMAYGVTSTTLLLAMGTNPATASATVHLAEIGTTLMSGASHWRFGNVDWKVVARIGVPGAVGAFLGATVLSALSTEIAGPLMSLILLGLGLYVLSRFTLRGLPRERLGQPLRKRFLSPLGLVAGFLDATGGGGWGPVGTPALLASGRMEPRKVIGSIDTSEFLVAVSASLGFLFSLGSQGLDWTWVAAFLLGGLIAAPVAAWLVRLVPPRVLGSAVGGVIIATNVRTLLKSDWIAASGTVSAVVYIAVYALWAAALTYSIREHVKEKENERAAAVGEPAPPAPQGGAGNRATGQDAREAAEPTPSGTL
ncbi:sulfite exporter TauE/SafE family protein [Streptomyces phaeolivaceus]|uniref:Probable membrane transporter protein n=1 Tax=Streptomyces phaeolivaceus TaxID=2653200 RepID=A0A5P8K2G7_9ACTN|nr:sulfite exporter TauE/SafE family protein [Streptomyces phaeolivaceus]QFQ96968.1 sulfite exporter TauE/SafE family protein [Streptomyces phaeolivaceus]